MIGKAVRVGLVATVAIGALTVGACSGADTGSTEVQGFSDFALQVDAPTGTLDATTARPVVEEFEKVSSLGADAGMWHFDSTDDGSNDLCASGGSARTSGEGDSSSGAVRVSYAGCCVEGGCCLDGIWHVAHDQGSSDTSLYSVCMNYDVSSVCDGERKSVEFVSCTDRSGHSVYSVQVLGKRYSVSGAHDRGSSALTIVDVKGTWTCTVGDGEGTCTGATGTVEF